jgi:multiple sugar transport system ATP-binding protein
VPATVTVIESLGHERHVICRLEDSTMIIVRQAADMTPPKEGESVRLAAAPEHLHVFDATSGARIGVH